MDNQSMVVRGVKLDVLGIEGWASLDPPELRLFPGDVGEATLLIRPPRSPSVAAGAHDFAVRARATDDGFSVVEEASITVAPFLDVSGSLRPQVARGRRAAKVDVRVSNRGNTRRRLALTADEPNDMLRFDVDPPYLLLEPGADGSAKVRMQVTQQAGPGERLPFEVRVHGDGGSPTFLEGALTITRPKGPWVARAAAILMALVIVLVAFAALRPEEVTTAARDAASRDEDSSTVPGLTTTTDTIAASASVSAETAVATSTPNAVVATDAGSTGSNEPGAAADPVAPTPGAAPAVPDTPESSATTATTARTSTTAASSGVAPPEPTTTSSTVPPRTTPAWAVVDSAGTLLRGGGAASATRSAAGQYVVTFANPTAGCAITASPTGTTARTVTVASVTALLKIGTSITSTTQVRVQLRDFTGAGVDNGFSVMKSCDKQLTAFAVVNPDGSVARSSSTAPSVARGKTGVYGLTYSSKSISATCTPVVTGGNSGTTIDKPVLVGVASATTVTLTSTTTFTVVVRDAKSGLGVDAGFHFALRCGSASPHGRFVNRQVQSGASQVAVYPDAGSSAVTSSTVGLTQARTSAADINTCATVVSARDATGTLATLNGASAAVSFVRPLRALLGDVGHVDIRTAASGGSVSRNVDVHVSCT